MPQEPNFKYDVFISFSSEDKQWVHDVLLKRIEAERFRALVYDRDFTPGAFIIKEIERGVQQCRKTLLILTRAYIESDWCEIENIIGYGRLIPLLKSPCSLPPRISAL